MSHVRECPQCGETYVPANGPCMTCVNALSSLATKMELDCECNSGEICEVCNPELLAKLEDDPLQGTDRHR